MQVEKYIQVVCKELFDAWKWDRVVINGAGNDLKKSDS